MNAAASKTAPALEQMLASILQYGSWLGSLTIWSGLVMSNERIAALGIALFLLLPALRVFVMFIVFFRERDYRLGTIAALVLMILFLGLALGMHTLSAGPSDQQRR